MDAFYSIRGQPLSLQLNFREVEKRLIKNSKKFVFKLDQRYF